MSLVDPYFLYGVDGVHRLLVSVARLEDGSDFPAVQMFHADGALASRMFSMESNNSVEAGFATFRGEGLHAFLGTNKDQASMELYHVASDGGSVKRGFRSWTNSDGSARYLLMDASESSWSNRVVKADRAYASLAAGNEIRLQSFAATNGYALYHSFDTAGQMRTSVGATPEGAYAG